MSNIPKGPAEAALAIADIQNQIFSLIEKSDSARCARVCRRWKESALDHVWNSMNSLIPLVQLLAPLNLVSLPAGLRKTLQFSRHLRAKDWENFMPYAERVKHLDMFLPETPISLDSSIFFELA
ncbi:hypothetical protein DFH11DRAFT_1545298 [Phellopilus nigrolimitatus]|nr:hypothetical protein DFH11DRAFT_1545298 [Phellopilus nigrolimitatus]